MRTRKERWKSGWNRFSKRFERTDAHVVKKPHLEILAKVNLFLGRPGGVLNRLLDVFLFQIRIALKNFLKTSRRGRSDLQLRRPECAFRVCMIWVSKVIRSKIQ